jgi:hypothetical protein
MVPEALNHLTAEERHRVYKMMRLNVVMYADGLAEVTGAFGGLLDSLGMISVKTESTSSSTVTSRTSQRCGSGITHHIEMKDERLKAPAQKRELGYAALGVMESYLEGRDFVVADSYSIADIALYAYTHVAGEGGFELDRFPAVRAWLERVREQPGHVPITRD